MASSARSVGESARSLRWLREAVGRHPLVFCRARNTYSATHKLYARIFQSDPPRRQYRRPSRAGEGQSRMSTKWIETTGKLILASQRVAAMWQHENGTFALEHIVNSCEVAILHEEQCLVLNDEPLPTTCMRTDLGIAFVRWVAAESDTEVLSHAVALIKRGERDCETKIHLSSESLLFDAGVGPSDRSPYASIPVRLREGMYHVSCLRDHSLAPCEVIHLAESV